MSLKFLNQFSSFDLDGFLKGKELRCTGCSEYKDYDTDTHLGTTVETVIVTDETPYKQKDGMQATNRYKELKIKVSKDISVPINSIVRPINGVATIYSKYRNELSIKATDIEIVQPQTQSQTNPQLQRNKS